MKMLFPTESSYFVQSSVVSPAANENVKFCPHEVRRPVRDITFFNIRLSLRPLTVVMDRS
jgi:hypothetical protein